MDDKDQKIRELQLKVGTLETSLKYTADAADKMMMHGMHRNLDAQKWAGNTWDVERINFCISVLVGNSSLQSWVKEQLVQLMEEEKVDNMADSEIAAHVARKRMLDSLIDTVGDEVCSY